MMRAVRCCKNSVCIDESFPKPIPPSGETVLQVLMAGICRTDLEITKGYMKFEGILGHEFVGKIEEENLPWPVGTRVTGEINAGCGKCRDCRRGLERHCLQRTTLGISQRDGCMAEWVSLPVQNLHPIPKEVPDAWAVFTEPLAAVMEIFEQIHIEPTHRVCILGDGKLGLLSALVFAHRHEGDLAIVGHHASNLYLVKNYLPTLMESTVPESFTKAWDVVIEATGRSSGLCQALKLVRPRGTIVLKSTMAQPEALNLNPIVIDEINVIGSRCGRFPAALALLARGVLPLDGLIETIFPLDKAQEAWECASRSGARKVLLRINGETEE